MRFDSLCETEDSIDREPLCFVAYVPVINELKIIKVSSKSFSTKREMNSNHHEAQHTHMITFV